MTFINITALSFPQGHESDVERRFANRDRTVDQAPGFVSFDLLRPVAGETRYFVMTTWQSRDDFLRWRDGGQRSGAHARGDRPGMSVDLMEFEVVQHD